MALKTVDIARELNFEDVTNTISVKSSGTPQKKKSLSFDEIENSNDIVKSPSPSKFDTYMPTPQRLNAKSRNSTNCLLDFSTPAKRPNKSVPKTSVALSKRALSSPPGLRRKSVSFARVLEDTCQFHKHEATSKIQEQKEKVTPKPRRKSILKMPGSTPKPKKKLVILEDDPEPVAQEAEIEQHEDPSALVDQLLDEEFKQVEELEASEIHALETPKVPKEDELDEIVSDSENDESFISVEEAHDTEVSARRVSVQLSPEASVQEKAKVAVEEQTEEELSPDLSELNDDNSLDFDDIFSSEEQSNTAAPDTDQVSEPNVSEQAQDEEQVVDAKSPTKEGSDVCQLSEESLYMPTSPPATFPSIYPTLPEEEEEEQLVSEDTKEEVEQESIITQDQPEEVEAAVSEDQPEEKVEDVVSEFEAVQQDTVMTTDDETTVVDEKAYETTSLEDHIDQTEEPSPEIVEKVSQIVDETSCEVQVLLEEHSNDSDDVRVIVEQKLVEQQETIVEPTEESTEEKEAIETPCTQVRSRLKRKRSITARKRLDLNQEETDNQPDSKRVKMTTLDDITEQCVESTASEELESLEHVLQHSPPRQEQPTEHESIAPMLTFSSPNPYSPTHLRRKSRISMTASPEEKSDFSFEQSKRNVMMSPSKVKASIRLSVPHEEEEPQHVEQPVVQEQEVVLTTQVRSRAARKKTTRRQPKEQPVQVEEPQEESKPSTPVKSRAQRKRRALKEQSPAKPAPVIELEEEIETTTMIVTTTTITKTRIRSPACSPKKAVVQLEEEDEEQNDTNKENINVTQVRSRKNRVVTSRRRQVKA
jgi:hypothetical protein